MGKQPLVCSTPVGVIGIETGIFANNAIAVDNGAQRLLALSELKPQSDRSIAEHRQVLNACWRYRN